MSKKESFGGIVPHPFDKWFKQKRTKLVRGKHFNCMPHSMGIQIRNAAKKRKVKVSIHIQGDILIVSIKK